MALSDVQICNLALYRVGVTERLSDFTDQSKAAQVCADIYPVIRDELLCAFPWGFATKRESLAALDDTRTGWAYVYALPTDFLQGIELVIQGSQAIAFWPWPFPFGPMPLNSRTPIPSQKPPYIIEAATDLTGSVLLSDATPAELKYIGQVTNTSAFTSLFTKALIWRLAEELAMPMMIKPDIANAAHAAARDALLEAIATDQRGSGEEIEPASEFEQSRY